ncbi:MAG TPA: hypothetical protein VMU20_15460 [Candidatus Dormibacteraeota bacterium]|nr:hypothetical protein [Candidatus Dormibacteraeota bacterium]
MSARCTFSFNGAAGYNPINAGGYDGPGVDVPNLLAMQWLPGQNVATYTAGGAEQILTLAALSHPTASRDLAVRIVPDPSKPDDAYTVEYRQKDGWDAGIPGNAVLIHELKSPPTTLPDSNPAPYSYIERSATTGQRIYSPVNCSWQAGGVWVDPQTNVMVRVLSIDPASGTAKVSVGPLSLFSPVPDVRITAPADGSQVTAGSPFELVSAATYADGRPLPASGVVWKDNGTTIGGGATLLTSLAHAGTHGITVTATDPSNQLSTTAAITLYASPAATAAPSPTPAPSGSPTASPTPTPLPAPPSATILSPTAGTRYVISGYGTESFQIVLSSRASSGVSGYTWSDSLGMLGDAKANDTVTVTATFQNVGCGTHTDTIHLFVTDAHGRSANAVPVNVTIDRECIQ